MIDKHFSPQIPFVQPNKKVLLDKDTAKVIFVDETMEGDAEIYLRFQPRSAIEIKVFWDKSLFILTSEAKSLRLEKKALNIPGFVSRFSGATDKGSMLFWRPKYEPIIAQGDDSTQLVSVIFHIFNFVEVFGCRGEPESVGNMSYAIAYTTLTHQDWLIDFRSLPLTGKVIKELKEIGGFGLTHIGRLRKEDNTSFTREEAYEMLTALRYFFSFARGRWSEPVCPVGFDNSGEKVWALWNSPRDDWKYVHSWFDPHHCEQLQTLFPLFMQRWRQENWQEALREVIYWYLNANDSSRGVDAAIILAQTAIERLSYELSVREKRLLTSNDFKTLWASDKFRLLFSTLGIPLEIPNDTPKLQNLAQELNWIDAPHALTEIRNSLVHPEHKNRDKVKGVYVEAWNLGQWFLEMSILGICGYKGVYGNRLKNRYVGEVEDVPWM